MICLDTNFLIELWRSRGNPKHPVRTLLARHVEEVLVVCVPAAGEFLEGAAFISEERYREAAAFLDLFETAGITMRTAGHYAHVVADLRRRKRLNGVSRADLWLAAWSLEHGATLASQNTRHFRHVPGLRLLSY